MKYLSGIIVAGIHHCGEVYASSSSSSSILSHQTGSSIFAASPVSSLSSLRINTIVSSTSLHSCYFKPISTCNLYLHVMWWEKHRLFFKFKFSLLIYIYIYSFSTAKYTANIGAYRTKSGPRE